MLGLKLNSNFQCLSPGNVMSANFRIIYYIISAHVSTTSELWVQWLHISRYHFKPNSAHCFTTSKNFSFKVGFLSSRPTLSRGNKNRQCHNGKRSLLRKHVCVYTLPPVRHLKLFLCLVFNPHSAHSYTTSIHTVYTNEPCLFIQYTSFIHRTQSTLQIHTDFGCSKYTTTCTLHLTVFYKHRFYIYTTLTK